MLAYRRIKMQLLDLSFSHYSFEMGWFLFVKWDVCENKSILFFSTPLLTCADVHNMVECVHALNNVHHQVGEANVILHDQWINRLWLDHVVHQVEPLGILQAALCQSLIGTLIIYSTTLDRKGGGVRGGCENEVWTERNVKEGRRNTKIQERKKERQEERKERKKKFFRQPVIVLYQINTQYLV